MLRHKSGAILRQVQALLGAGTFSGLSDLQLLERFLERRDEVSELAIAVLVERHGPMVLGVCRRILGDPHDAEDAFQATFLVLARKGRSIRVEGSLGRWLFGVATRVATRARPTTIAADGSASGPGSIGSNRRVRTPSSDRDANGPRSRRSSRREIAGLPARFQSPVLLCDLEGSCCEEAARRLGWPTGTVKSRLYRARARLRDRLTRRGLAPADFSIVTALLPAAPSPGLVAATTRAASAWISGRLATAGIVSASVATLTQGVLQDHDPHQTQARRGDALAGRHGLGGPARPGLPPEAGRRGHGHGSSAAAFPAKAGTAPKSDEQVDLEMLERAWIDAINRHDAAVVNRILADDFEGIDPVGNVYSKPTYLPDLRNGVFNSAPIELDQMKTRVFGETGVVTSRFKIHDPPRALMTHVYIRRGAGSVWPHTRAGPPESSAPHRPRPRQKNASPKRLDAEKRVSAAIPSRGQQLPLACHGGDVQAKFQPDPAPGATRAMRLDKPATPLQMPIDAGGTIAIDGKAVIGEEGHGRAAPGRPGSVAAVRLVLSAASSTPYHVVDMVATAAKHAGFSSSASSSRKRRTPISPRSCARHSMAGSTRSTSRRGRPSSRATR